MFGSNDIRKTCVQDQLIFSCPLTMDIIVNSRKNIATTVSIQDAEVIKPYKLYYSSGYVEIIVNDKRHRLHRYIMQECMKENIPATHVIDHINNNPLDNRRENLRSVTYSENSRNKRKQSDTSSKYHGVSYHKVSKNWKASIKVGKKTHIAYYDNEVSAAYQYNLWLERFNCVGGKYNKVTCPKDFREWVSQSKTKELPKGITVFENKFRVRIYIGGKRKHIGLFSMIDEAKEALKNVQPTTKIKSKHFVDENGHTIVVSSNKKHIIVDKEKLDIVIPHTWRVGQQGYAIALINNEYVSMSRYILKYAGENVVDHINGNRIDNRIENLRICTPHQNAMNKKKNNDKYIGVRKIGNKWKASIKFKNKHIYIGTFDTELEAAKARDEATKKFFGDYGTLNLS